MHWSNISMLGMIKNYDYLLVLPHIVVDVGHTDYNERVNIYFVYY